MKDTTCGFGVALPVAQADAVNQVTEALKAEGFGVLTSAPAPTTMQT